MIDDRKAQWDSLRRKEAQEGIVVLALLMGESVLKLVSRSRKMLSYFFAEKFC